MPLAGLFVCGLVGQVLLVAFAVDKVLRYGLLAALTVDRSHCRREGGGILAQVRGVAEVAQPQVRGLGVGDAQGLAQLIAVGRRDLFPALAGHLPLALHLCRLFCVAREDQRAKLRLTVRPAWDGYTRGRRRYGNDVGVRSNAVYRRRDYGRCDRIDRDRRGLARFVGGYI